MIIASTENMVFSLSSDEKNIEAKIPVAMKNYFKDVFRTAKWNASSKVWILKNTVVSRNKAVKFCTCMAPVEAKVIEAMEAEDNDLDIAITNIDRRAAELLEKIKDKEELISEYRVKKEKLKEKEIEVSELLLENERKEKELFDHKEKFRIILDEHRSDGDSVPDMICELRKLIKAYRYSKLAWKKYNIYVLMRRIGKAYDEILEKTGISYANLYKISEINLNRLDRDYELLDEDLLNNIKVS